MFSQRFQLHRVFWLVSLCLFASGAFCNALERITFKDGFLPITKFRTLGRFHRGLGQTEEWPKLRARAQETLKLREPTPWKTLFVIARSLEVDWVDSSKAKRHSVITLSPADISKFRAVFDQFCEMVSILSNGNAKIEYDYVLLDKPLKKISTYGDAYWLRIEDALDPKQVPAGKYDGIILYYPAGDVPQAIIGGTFGKDNGFQKASTSSIMLGKGDLEQPAGPKFHYTAIVTLHEWLHQTTFTARRQTGYTYTPDPHSAGMLGYQFNEGGYPDWMAWYRDLMLDYYSPGYWRRMTNSLDYDPAPEPVNARLRPLAFYDWNEVKTDWQRWLPMLDEAALRERTRNPKLTLGLKQYKKGGYVQLEIGGFDARTARSPLTTARESDTALNNVMSLGTLANNPALEDLTGGYRERPMEGMAIVRYRTATRYRDLIFLRMDLIEPVLSLLRVIGSRTPSKSVIGFVSLPEPTEGQLVTFLVLDTDLGRKFPKDEVAALGF